MKNRNKKPRDHEKRSITTTCVTLIHNSISANATFDEASNLFPNWDAKSDKNANFLNHQKIQQEETFPAGGKNGASVK